MDHSLQLPRRLDRLLSERLPAPMFRRLQEVGALAREYGLPAFAVGGVVRDVCLARQVVDADVVVEGDGMAFVRAVADRTGAGLKIFDRFGTALIVFPDRVKLDVANARSDRGLLSDVSPVAASCSIEQDLRRRDLTINALAVNLAPAHFGTVLDVVGGLPDLEQRTIRAVYASGFHDDATRIFRAVRFEQALEFIIEDGTLALLRQAAAADRPASLPIHRLRNEVLLILDQAEPRRFIRRMAELDVLRFIHPAMTLTPGRDVLLSTLPAVLETWGHCYPADAVNRSLLHLMALLTECPGAELDEVVVRLRLTGRAERTVRSVRAAAGIGEQLSGMRSPRPSTVNRLLAGLPPEGLVLLLAASGDERIHSHVSAYLRTYRCIRPAVDGHALAAMGLPEGPSYRTVFESLRDAKLDATVQTDGDEWDLARALVKKMTGQRDRWT